MPRVDLHPKSIWSESQSFQTIWEDRCRSVLGLQLLHLASQVPREARGTRLIFLCLYSGRGKMRLWKLVLVGDPAVTSLDLHSPTCHWPRKKEKEEDYDIQMFPKSTLTVLLISLGSGLVGHSPTSPGPSGHFGSSSSCLKLKSKPCPQILVFLARPKKISKMLGETSNKS